jgi:hypothetical protein
LAGDASGIDWIVASASDSGAVSASLRRRVAAKRAARGAIGSVTG